MRTPEEREALGHRDALDEMSAYLDEAGVAVGADLTLLDPAIPRDERDRIQISRAMAQAEVHRFESLYATTGIPGEDEAAAAVSGGFRA